MESLRVQPRDELVAGADLRSQRRMWTNELQSPALYSSTSAADKLGE